MKSKYEIIDNFLPKEDFIKLKDTILHYNFPWFFQNQINHLHSLKDTSFYFTHVIYVDEQNSNHYKLMKDLFFHRLKMKALIRIKVNLYPHTSKISVNKKHVDMNFKHKAALFSINTCNGFTTLEDGTKINSIENRMLLFDASKVHASSTCSDKKARFNINFNYF
jgi:hypothetical protein